MTRLKSFLTEAIDPKPPFSPDQAAELIQQNCKPFLQQIKGHGFLWRGSHATDLNLIEVVKPRKDRLPMNMPERIHKALNEGFKVKFGWRVRSEGVFCTGDRAQASSYGHVRTIWPIGDFKFVWSNKIADLVNYIPHSLYYNTWPQMPVKEILKDSTFIKLMELYTDKDLGIAIRKGREVSIKCKQYYSIIGDWARHISIRELVQ